MAHFCTSLIERYFPRFARERRFRCIRDGTLWKVARDRTSEPEIFLLPALLSDVKGACFDIGAHIGEYTYALERVVGPERVFAFEPNPKSARMLRSFFPHAHVLEAALSDHAEGASLAIPQIGAKHYATRGTLESHQEPGETGREVFSVRTMTLDVFVEQERIDVVSFLKIDVEGHEENVLCGGVKTIAMHHPILLVEIEQRHHSEDIREVIGKVVATGYEGWFLDLTAWEFRSTDVFDPARWQQYDKLKTADYVNNFFFFSKNQSRELQERMRCLLQGEYS